MRAAEETRSTTSWVRTVAAWVSVPLGVPLGPDAVDEAARRVHARLRRELRDLGAVAVGETSLQLSTNLGRTIGCEPELVAVLAEVRAITLRNPNPFPTIRLFRWLPW